MVDLGPLSQDPWLPPTLPWPPDTDEGRGMKQLALPVAHRRWLWNGVAATVMILLEIEYVALGALAWWLLCLSVPLAAVNWTGWWKTRPPKPNVPTANGQRTPAFPGGRNCPSGCCPICGQYDPGQLDWEGCHGMCVEWLGYVPARAVATVQHQTGPRSNVVFLTTTHGLKPGQYELQAPDGRVLLVRAHSVTALALHIDTELDGIYPAGTRVIRK